MIRLFLILLLFNFPPVKAFENIKINFGNYSLNKYEITIEEFKSYAKKNNITTEAEKTGGGYEWGAGWEKREGWNYRTPYGKIPKSNLEPAVHISRFEAENYCKSINGRLPSFDEWSKAAYTQQFNSNEFLKGKTYEYPSGDKAEKMNSQGLLNYDKHVDVTSLPEGINGLVAMGGNVWEWIDDTRKDNSLTAGASWWYGASKTRKQGAQYKPSNFYAIYVGFRCAFDVN
jgi:formylglycine-generating enzyme